MRNPIPYTIVRNGIFYLNYRLPLELSKGKPRFIRKSLNTDSNRQARLFICKIKPSIDFFVSIWRKEMELLEDTEVDLILSDFSLALEFMLNCYLNPTSNKHWIEYFGGWVEHYPPEEEARTDMLKYIGDVAKEGEYEDKVTNYLEFCNVGKDNVDYGSLFKVLHRFFLIGKNVIKCTEQGEIEQAEKGLNTLKNYSNNALRAYNPELDNEILAAEAEAEQEPDSNSAILLSQAISEFMDFKNKLSPKIRSSHERMFEVTLCVLEDKPIDQITRQDFEHVIDIASHLPKGNKKPYNRLSIAESVKLAQSDEVPEEDLVAKKTVKEYLKLFQGLFSTYLIKEKDLLTVNPVENIRVNVTLTRYGNFSETQIKMFLTYWVKQDDSALKWIFLLGIYTGARASELASLTFDAIKRDEDTDRLYILIKEGKTDAARRQIPIHNKLINLGFIEFINQHKENPAQSLFPKFNTKKLPQKVVEVLKSHCISDVDDHGQRLRFHSFRHTVITKAMAYNNTSNVQQVVGHEQSEAGETKRYTHKSPLKDVLGVIDCLDW